VRPLTGVANGDVRAQAAPVNRLELEELPDLSRNAERNAAFALDFRTRKWPVVTEITQTGAITTIFGAPVLAEGFYHNSP
jgi:hypothetical protein